MKLFKSIFFYLAVASLASFLVFACTKDVNPDPTELIGRWRLIEIIYQDSIITKPNPYNQPFEVEIEFFDDARIRGTTSSNTTAGTYQVSDSDSITILHSLESKVGENSWGRYFNQVIHYVQTYALKNKMLYLNYDDSKLIFTKVK